jgi:hypothetical protein
MHWPDQFRFSTSLRASKLRIEVMPCFLKRSACSLMMSEGWESSATMLTPRERVCRSASGQVSAELVHHVEGVFLAVEVAGLETGAAAGLEPADAGVVGGLDGRHEVSGEDAGPVDGLEAVAEGGAHELDLLGGHGESSLRWDFEMPGKGYRPRRRMAAAMATAVAAPSFALALFRLGAGGSGSGSMNASFGTNLLETFITEIRRRRNTNTVLMPTSMRMSP